MSTHVGSSINQNMACHPTCTWRYGSESKTLGFQALGICIFACSGEAKKKFSKVEAVNWAAGNPATSTLVAQPVVKKKHRHKHKAPDKVRIFISIIHISLSNHMFHHLLESSHQDDFNKYSQPCEQRPPKGNKNCGICWEVVFVQMSIS